MRAISCLIAAASLCASTAAMPQGGVRVAVGDVDGDGKGQKTAKDVKKPGAEAAAVAVPSIMRNSRRGVANDAGMESGTPTTAVASPRKPGTAPTKPTGKQVKAGDHGPTPATPDSGIPLGGGGSQAPKPTQGIQAKPTAPAALLVPAVQK